MENQKENNMAHETKTGVDGGLLRVFQEQKYHFGDVQRKDCGVSMPMGEKARALGSRQPFRLGASDVK